MANNKLDYLLKRQIIVEDTNDFHMTIREGDSVDVDHILNVFQYAKKKGLKKLNVKRLRDGSGANYTTFNSRFEREETDDEYHARVVFSLQCCESNAEHSKKSIKREDASAEELRKVLEKLYKNPKYRWYIKE